MVSRPQDRVSGLLPLPANWLFYLVSPENTPAATSERPGIYKFGTVEIGNDFLYRYTEDWIPESRNRCTSLAVRCKLGTWPEKYEDNLRSLYRKIGALCSGQREWIYITESMKYKLIDMIKIDLAHGGLY